MYFIVQLIQKGIIYLVTHLNLGSRTVSLRFLLIGYIAALNYLTDLLVQLYTMSASEEEAESINDNGLVLAKIFIMVILIIFIL